MVRKQLPNTHLLKVENIDNSSFLKLKTYMHLIKICEVIYEQLEVVEDEYNLESYDTLLCIVNLKLAIYRMQHVLDLNSKKQINKFQLQNLFVLYNFFQQVILDDVITKIQLGENSLDEILDVMTRAAQLSYPKMPKCTICEDNILFLLFIEIISNIFNYFSLILTRIISSLCQPVHFTSYCAISMMQLDIYSSYKCPFCKCRVHTELKKEMDILYCPYCDVPLNFHEFERKITTNKVNLSCKEDCSTEVLAIDVVEDEAVR